MPPQRDPIQQQRRCLPATSPTRDAPGSLGTRKRGLPDSRSRRPYDSRYPARRGGEPRSQRCGGHAAAFQGTEQGRSRHSNHNNNYGGLCFGGRIVAPVRIAAPLVEAPADGWFQSCLLEHSSNSTRKTSYQLIHSALPANRSRLGDSWQRKGITE